MTRKIRIGESIFQDLIKEGEDTTDSQNCTYYIKDENDEIKLTGVLEVVDNTFMLRITSDDTSTLEKKLYTLQVAFTDTDTGYLDYIIDENLLVI